jgi:hypothetical protein
MQLLEDVHRNTAAVARSGTTAGVLDLPARGVPGNSHIPMMDDNNDDIARLVATWIAEQRAAGRQD